jgi:hypothetical protein
VDKWSQIQIRDFWDVPRAVIARMGQDLFFFDSRFDESTDEYLDHYEVWRLPILAPDVLAGSWAGIQSCALERMPNVGLHELPFDIPRNAARSPRDFGNNHGSDV